MTEVLQANYVMHKYLCSSITILSTFITTKNTVISPSFLVWKLCWNAQLPQNLGWITQNSMETVGFHKFSRKLGKISVFSTVPLTSFFYCGYYFTWLSENVIDKSIALFRQRPEKAHAKYLIHLPSKGSFILFPLFSQNLLKFGSKNVQKMRKI